MGEKEVLRYLSLLDRKMDIYINSGINWKPEYEAELENINKELAQLRHLIDNEHVRRNKKMNNDLISRNEVIKAIDELGYVNCHDGKDFEANSRIDKIRQRIVEMPTAYDVDKVVEKLEQ